MYQLVAVKLILPILKQALLLQDLDLNILLSLSLELNAVLTKPKSQQIMTNKEYVQISKM